MSEKGGFRTVPPYTGQRPPRMRKSDDFPHPFGPTTRRWSPGLKEKDNALTSTSPLGEMMGLHIFSDFLCFGEFFLHINKFYVLTFDDFPSSS